MTKLYFLGEYRENKKEKKSSPTTNILTFTNMRHAKRKKTRQSFKQHVEMTGLITRRHACIAQKVWTPSMC